jgi:Family of unknown function (DUF6491)
LAATVCGLQSIAQQDSLLRRRKIAEPPRAVRIKSWKEPGSIEGEFVKLRGSGVALFLAAFAGGAVHATEAASRSTAPEASIPFVRHGGIRNWEADRNRGVWIQDVHRNWYYATLMAPCFGLDFATSLGFDAGPTGDFDRFSAIVVPREGRCPVRSFAASDGPPGKQPANTPAEDRG